MTDFFTALCTGYYQKMLKADQLIKEKKCMKTATCENCGEEIYLQPYDNNWYHTKTMNGYCHPKLQSGVAKPLNEQSKTSIQLSFYVIWRLVGGKIPSDYRHSPTKLHFSKEDALAEAERLAKENVGIEFSVCQVYIRHQVQATITVEKKDAP